MPQPLPAQPGQAPRRASRTIGWIILIVVVVLASRSERPMFKVLAYLEQLPRR